jgi:hypothetical protein
VVLLIVGSSDADAAVEAPEKARTGAVAVAVVVNRIGSDTLEMDSPAVGREQRTAVEEAADVDVEVADMRSDTAVVEAVGNDSAMELAKDNGPALAAGYIEARNTPFGRTSRRCSG